MKVEKKHFLIKKIFNQYFIDLIQWDDVISKSFVKSSLLLRFPAERVSLFHWIIRLLLWFGPKWSKKAAGVVLLMYFYYHLKPWLKCLYNWEKLALWQIFPQLKTILDSMNLAFNFKDLSTCILGQPWMGRSVSQGHPSQEMIRYYRNCRVPSRAASLPWAAPSPFSEPGKATILQRDSLINEGHRECQTWEWVMERNM